MKVHSDLITVPTRMGLSVQTIDRDSLDRIKITCHGYNLTIVITQTGEKYSVCFDIPLLKLTPSILPVVCASVERALIENACHYYLSIRKQAEFCMYNINRIQELERPHNFWVSLLTLGEIIAPAAENTPSYTIVNMQCPISGCTIALKFAGNKVAVVSPCHESLVTHIEEYTTDIGAQHEYVAVLKILTQYYEGLVLACKLIKSSFSSAFGEHK